MTQPLVIDLFAGLFGFSAGFVAEGWSVVGFDLQDMHAEFGLERPEEFNLVIQDVMTLHGSQFRSAACIIASPPCQKYSWMAMPWKRAKVAAAEIRADETGQKLADLNRLFDACFRIQAEASLAAGRHVPLIVENVRGAIPWVGRSRANFGSFHLWGDVPALMPSAARAQKVPGFRFDGSGRSFQTASVEAVKVPSESGRRTDVGKGARFTSRDCGVEGTKVPGISFSGYGEEGYKAKGFNVTAAQQYREGIKQAGISGVRENGKGDRWFQDGAARHGSKSNSRKAASAQIAKIPFPLSQFLARTFHPNRSAP